MAGSTITLLVRGIQESIITCLRTSFRSRIDLRRAFIQLFALSHKGTCSGSLNDPRVLQLFVGGYEKKERWPVGVWFGPYLVLYAQLIAQKPTIFLQFFLHDFFAQLKIPSPIKRSSKRYPKKQVDIFMAVALIASHKAASICRGAKSAAEDT